MAVLAGVAMPASGAIGGPDAFGYTWVDADDGGPAYDYFITTGAPLPLNDDDGSTVVQLPFAFEYYGQGYSQIRLQSNGGLTFGSTEDLGPSHTCPVENQPAPSILPLWMDLDPGQSGDFYAGSTGTAPTRTFVIEWFGIAPFSNTGSGQATFEVKLFEADHHIEFHYQDLDFVGSDLDDGETAVIGLARPSGSLLYSCDGARVITGGQAIGFYPPQCDDVDGDGACAADDCNNNDADIYPGAVEVCDGKDNDCDGSGGDGEIDADLDGYMVCEADCDDTDPTLYPADLDGDGWTPCLGDCDDADPNVNQIDNDADGVSGCDGDCDDTDPSLNLLDADGDGAVSCENDCDDDDPSVFVGAPELCDEQDNDCDGTIDENPNCGGDDDDDDGPASEAVAYGCFVRCDASGEPAPFGSGWMLVGVLGALGLLRRRRGASA